ncbi:MAG TPA: PDZ domain-containing protein [Tepidisphaeraceae bacterium]|jgi:hypothetical protein
MIRTAMMGAIAVSAWAQAPDQPATARPDDPAASITRDVDTLVRANRLAIDLAGRPATRAELNRIAAGEQAGATDRAVEHLLVAQAAQPPGADVAPVAPTPRPRRIANPANAAPGGGAPPITGGFVPKPVQPAKKEKVTYLGVFTSPAAPAIREQLKMPVGVGLSVDAVETGTAAEKAGVKQHDVLEKLDDQWLVNTEQLNALVRSKKSGDAITLSILRQGERQPIKATLEEKEIEVGAWPQPMAGNFTPKMPQMALPGRLNTVRLTQDDPAIVEFTPNQQGLVAQGLAGIAADRVMVRTLDGKQKTEWADGEVSIAIERANGNTTNIIVTDQPTGKQIYTGGPELLESLYKARPELRDKMKKAMGAATAQPVRLRFAPGVNVTARAAGGKVVRWQDDDHILIMRMSGRNPTYLLALSKKDGHTVFDGPVAKEEDRKSVPAEVAEEFQMLCGQPDMAQELGGAPKPAAAGGVGGAPAAAPPPAPRLR